jgi:glycosyltransferase involved in cell wall biosynthesis
MISITIPVYNEAENLPLLYERLRATLEHVASPWEIVLVNDGSTDASGEVLDRLAANDDRVKVIHFRKNFGQTAAMMAGVDHAHGEVIIPMDADLQNDPQDIPHLLHKLNEGYDVVSGWRKDRKDQAVNRNFLSRVANRLISTISGVHLHDYGCSLKAYRRSVIKGVKLYGEMHRFIPIYASWFGARIAEIPVAHHPRKFGRSNYGVDRVIKVLLDLVVVNFLARYSQKPMYVFGSVGMVSFAVSFLSGFLAIYLKIFEDISFISTPLPLLVVMTFLTGAMCILMGLLAELIMRTYFESQGKSTYLVGETRNLKV